MIFIAYSLNVKQNFNVVSASIQSGEDVSSISYLMFHLTWIGQTMEISPELFKISCLFN